MEANKSPSIVTFLILLLLLLGDSGIFASDPSEIVIKPKNQQVRNGGVAAFYCAARGDPQPVIHWKKNGNKVTSTQSRYQVKEFSSGEVLLRIEPVEMNGDAANYECVAENGRGEVAIANASLTVFKADKIPSGFPQITQHPAANTVIEIGHSTVFTCTVSGNPPPKITWYRNMLPIDVKNEPRYSMYNDLPGNLQIKNSEEKDQGMYECVVENSVGTEYSKPVTLYVKVRKVSPRFLITPKQLNEVMSGSDLNLTCVADGSPMPYVKWRKGLQELTPEDDLPIAKNTLELKNIKESANYTCVASSDLGQIEAIAQVTVQSLPGPPTNVSVSGVNATSVKLTWNYNEPKDLLYYVVQFKPKLSKREFKQITFIITKYYLVRNLNPSTEYEMYVFAVNKEGKGPASSPVIVTTSPLTTGEKPGTYPKIDLVYPLGARTVGIQWEEPETPNGQVTGYIVYYTKNAEPQFPISQWQSQIVENKLLTIIRGLTPETVYTMRVQVVTSFGPGPLSFPVFVETGRGISIEPKNLRASHVGETSVTIEWNKPLHLGEPIASYELFWNDTYAKETHHRHLPVSVPESYTLMGLYPNTLYYVWLAAKDHMGEQETSHPPIPIRTKQYKPNGPPRNVSAIAVSPTSIEVSWKPQPANGSNGNIVYYKLQVVEASRSDSEASVIKFLVEDLKPWTEYRIWLSAGTLVGDGPTSYPITVRTHENGFRGHNCEENIDDCPGHQCQNGATCVDNINSYTCQCPSTYTGRYCEQDVDECSSLRPSVCQNGATCLNSVGGFSCVCVNGWTGPDCSTNIDDCAAAACFNGATCIDGVGTFYCRCTPGKTGLLCHLDDACASNPCHADAICDTSPINGSYICSSASGYKGILAYV